MCEVLIIHHPLLFYHAVAYDSLSRKRSAPVTTTFSNFRGGRLRKLRLYCTIINAVNIFFISF